MPFTPPLIKELATMINTSGNGSLSLTAISYSGLSQIIELIILKDELVLILIPPLSECGEVFPLTVLLINFTCEIEPQYKPKSPLLVYK